MRSAASGARRLLMALRISGLFAALMCLIAQGRAEDQAPRPRIHIYNLPEEYAGNCHWFSCGMLTNRLKRSQYYESDPDKADFFWIPMHLPAKDQDMAGRMYNYIKQTWPYWNRSIEANEVRHFVGLVCDHGPGDCDYINREKNRLGGYPSDWGPIETTRVVGHLMWNGMRDGPDSGNPNGPCLVCFQKGKDIQLVTAQNVCGPLCGYSREELARVSLWENATRPVEEQRGAALAKHAERVRYQHIHEPDRPSWVFFGGNIHPVEPPQNDHSGRRQVQAWHGNRTGWRIHSTLKDENVPIEEQVKVRINFAEEMARAMFCYSPLGQFVGDTDRYVAGAMFGCIPIMLTDVQYGGGRDVLLAQPYEEHPDFDWEAFAVLVSSRELHRLDEILAALTPQQIKRKRAHLARIWPKFLWSSIYGPYLGEDGSDDAFEALMEVFRQRLLRFEAARAQAALPGGGAAAPGNEAAAAAAAAADELPASLPHAHAGPQLPDPAEAAREAAAEAAEQEAHHREHQHEYDERKRARSEGAAEPRDGKALPPDEFPEVVFPEISPLPWRRR